MNRRHGLVGQILYIVTAPWRWLGMLFRSAVVVPYYELSEGLRSLRDGVLRAAGVRNFGAFLVHILLWLPNSLGALVVWILKQCWWALTSWPRLMHWRDLAAGLPALIVASLAIIALMFLKTTNNELIADYQTRMQEAYTAAGKETEPEQKKAEVERAFFFARSLARLAPDDKFFRYDLAMLYSGLGDEARGQAIMTELAPRGETGFGPAHFWQARQILSRPLSQDDFQTAVAHLDKALKSENIDRNEVHRQLGELYFQAYMSQETGGINPLKLTKQKLLENARLHFMQYKGDDIHPVLRLGSILAMQGNYEQARLSVQQLIAQLKTKLQTTPSDIDTRLELARAHASVLELNQAQDVLQEGRILKPDERFDRELSNVFFAQALEFQRNMPSASALPYQALRAAFEANPGNGMVIARLLQSLSGAEADAALARKMLTELPPNLQQHGVAQFLLGFDAQRRALPQLAEQHYFASRNAKDNLAPAVIAEVAFAVMERKYTAIPGPTGALLYNEALKLWPAHPDLLYMRAKTNFQAKQYSIAISDLNKAVAAKKNNVTLALRLADDVRLHSLLAASYRGNGQQANAEEQNRLAQAAATLREPLK